MEMRVDKLEPIISKSFFKDIIENGGEIFFIGGSVRDMFLGIEPKDIDLIARLIPFTQLTKILSRHGRVDLVGESFGVIKFKEFETNFEVEIALPRRDYLDKTKKGHTAIIAQSDEMLPIEVDLKRRDFLINSIAISHNLQLIDPLNGLKDIEEKVIRATDETAFVEDALRMIRATQFSARFGFSIEPKTFDLIKSHAHLIKYISPERMLMEFQKVIDKKGDWIIFLDLLDSTGLWGEYFGFKMGRNFGTVRPTTMAELLIFSVRSEKRNTNFGWSTVFEKALKIDTKTKKELDALQNITIINSRSEFNDQVIINRKLIFNCLRSCPWALELPYFELNGVENDFKSAKYPKSYKELKITGDDLIEMGFEQGKEIGRILENVIMAVLEDKIENDGEQIKKFINK